MTGCRAALAVSVLLALASCRPWAVPAALVGTWTGTARATVRVRAERGGDRFLSDTVAIALTVRADGSVEGRVGGAVLEESYVLRNRGWFGRALHLGTDYRLEGRLQGHLFAADPLPTKDVRAPFGVTGDTLAGTIFQVAGLGVYPMAAPHLLRPSRATP